jgi:alanine racemase
MTFSTAVHRPLRLRLDGDALVSNWRWLKDRSGTAACGAAVKADGYGLGAREVVRRLAAAGCHDFYVSSWAEAAEVEPLLDGASLGVLHGVLEEDQPATLASTARPVLNTAAQVLRWRSTGRPCDVMVDTGIHRLGLTPEEVRSGILDGLQIETLHSHLACADEDVAANQRQLRLFAELGRVVPARRRSLANSAGICLGTDYAFDLTRPGLALYGGIPRAEAEGHICPVARLEAQVIQRRRVPAGGSVGYNATWTADRDCELAILHIGYADGYLRGFSGRGRAWADGVELPVVGRVSMDLTAVRVDAAPHVGEGDWVEIDFDLPRAAEQSGLSQYELLTTLGSRYERIWS